MANNINCEISPNCVDCNNKGNYWLTGGTSTPNILLDVEVTKYTNIYKTIPIGYTSTDMGVNTYVFTFG